MSSIVQVLATVGYLELWPAKGKRQHPVPSSEMMSLYEEVVYKQYFEWNI